MSNNEITTQKVTLLKDSARRSGDSKDAHRARYDRKRFLLENSSIYTPFLDAVRRLESSRAYLVNESVAYAPDLISYRVWGIEHLYWIMMDYNRLSMISDLKIGTVIRVPSLSAIDTVYFNLIGAQKTIIVGEIECDYYWHTRKLGRPCNCR